jgi:hypothetical protein
LGAPDLTTHYSLCVFDHLGNTPVFALGFNIPPSGTWTQRGTCSFVYKDRDATLVGGGLRTLSVAASADPDRSSRVAMTAKGQQLDLPPPFDPDRFFALEPSLKIQLSNDQGQCWESEFDEPFINAPSRFKTRRIIRVP